MKPTLCCMALLAFLLASCAAASPSALTPARHSDFQHYTFALTWQPGFCSAAGSCLQNPQQNVLIGLHGLWASRPQSLIDSGVAAPQWWRHGCDYFHHSDKAPALTRDTLKKLQRVMPHLRHSLLTHEYDKHVQCFGFDAQRFFDTELSLRQRIVSSDFGHYLLRQERGHTVRHKDVINAFTTSFHTDQRAALQLRCGTDASGRKILTQLWITLHASALDSFPYGNSLMDAPITQDNCPQTFRVPPG